VIMPLEVGALLLDTVGLGRPLWFLCGLSIDGLLWLAHWVASARGAVAMTPTLAGWAFGLMVVGRLWICLWTTRIRLWGAVPAALGATAALLAPSPDLLVSGDGKHVAVVDAEGATSMLRDRTGAYMRSLLAEASGFDGDPLPLAERPYSVCTRDACIAALRHEGGEWRLLATRSSYRLDWARLTESCAAADIAVSDRRLPPGLQAALAEA